MVLTIAERSADLASVGLGPAAVEFGEIQATIEQCLHATRTTRLPWISRRIDSHVSSPMGLGGSRCILDGRFAHHAWSFIIGRVRLGRDMNTVRDVFEESSALLLSRYYQNIILRDRTPIEISRLTKLLQIGAKRRLSSFVLHYRSTNVCIVDNNNSGCRKVV
jgi:hypothetical protein